MATTSMATSSPPALINHSVREGTVNLIQVASYVTGDKKNAGRNADRACSRLNIGTRGKIDGVGQHVLLGSYEDAVKLAVELNASPAALAAVKDALKLLVSAQGGGEDMSDDQDKESLFSKDETPLDITLFPTKEEVADFIESKDPFPVKLNTAVAAWLEFRHYHSARNRVKEVAEAGDIVVNVDFIDQVCGRNPMTGREIKMYAFTLKGFRIFCSMLKSSKGRLVRRYFVEVEKEMMEQLPQDISGNIQRAALDNARQHIVDHPQIDVTKQQEDAIQRRYASIFGGMREVSCMFGKVDVVTDTHVVEVKAAAKYKHAIGQVLTYAQCFPGKRKRIHLFGDEKEDFDSFQLARIACNPLDIDVSVEFI